MRVQGMRRHRPARTFLLGGVRFRAGLLAKTLPATQFTRAALVTLGNSIAPAPRVTEGRESKDYLRRQRTTDDRLTPVSMLRSVPTEALGVRPFSLRIARLASC